MESGEQPAPIAMFRDAIAKCVKEVRTNNQVPALTVMGFPAAPTLC